MSGRRVVIGAVVAASVAIGVVAVVTQTGSKACTKVGCGNGAAVDLVSLDPAVRDRAATYTVCIDGRCRTTASDAADTSGVWGDLERTSVAEASLAVVDATGVEVARFDLVDPVGAEVSYPNGEDCEPPCPQLRLAVADGVLRKATA